MNGTFCESLASPSGSRPATSTRAGGGRGFAAAGRGVRARARSLRGPGRAAGVDGVDDLCVVDALEVDRGDAEVGVPELALDDDQRHALARHLDGVGVAELVRCEASPHFGLAGDASQRRAGGGGRPWPSARGAVDDAEQWSTRELDVRPEPRRELLPGPVVHADLAAPAALAALYQQ